MPSIPDVSLTYQIPPSPTWTAAQYLVLDVRDDQLSIRRTGQAISTRVLGINWDTSNLAGDSLDTFETYVTQWYSAIRDHERSTMEKVIVGALWWMSRTVLGPVPEWLQGMQAPTGLANDPTTTSHGNFNSIVAWMSASGYRTSPAETRVTPPRDANGRFTSTGVWPTETATPASPYNRIHTWTDIPAGAECAFCGTDKVTDEENNGGVNSGWWFVAETFHNDSSSLEEDVYLCDACWHESQPCTLSGCNVRSQYREEVRTGRRSYVQFCTPEVHEDFVWCDACERYIESDNNRWNDHLEMCTWCADDADLHEDCEDCGTEHVGHDEDCYCDYCGWMDNGEDEDDQPEVMHCTCEYCEEQHQVNMANRAYRDREQATRRINSYSYRPYYNYFPSGLPIVVGTPGPRRLHIGIEIEVSFKPSYIEALSKWLPKYEIITDPVVAQNFSGLFQELPKFIFVKGDSSVTNGFEIVTMPFEPEWGLVGFPWEAAFGELIRDFGAHPEHASTGQHIHISKDSFDMAHFWKFFQFHQKLGEFCGMVGGRGSRADYGSFHASAWKNMKPVLMELSKAKGKYNSDKMYNWYPERYSAINTLNETTIELRYPAGNIEPANIRKNIQWVWAVYEYTNYIDIKDVTEGALDTPNNFLWWVKDQPEKFADLIRYIERIIPQPKPLRERS